MTRMQDEAGRLTPAASWASASRRSRTSGARTPSSSSRSARRSPRAPGRSRCPSRSPSSRSTTDDRRTLPEPQPAGRDLPEAAVRRLESTAFSSGLSVPDFAACLDLGLQPVALVQGFCVMQWGWYGPGSGYMRGMSPYVGGPQRAGSYSETYRCPHGFVSNEHRSWGQNLEQPWVEDAWAQGYGSAYQRMLEEATTHGAHGVIGVVDRVSSIADTGTTEFHFLGTAVTVDGGPPPAGGVPVEHLPGGAAAHQVHRGRFHARGGGGRTGLGPGLGLLHDRVPHGGQHELGLADRAASRRAGEQGPHGGAPAGPQARPPAAGGRRAPRRHHRRGRPRAVAGRRGHRLHAAGQPGAEVQGLRPGGPARDPTVRLA